MEFSPGLSAISCCRPLPSTLAENPSLPQKWNLKKRIALNGLSRVVVYSSMNKETGVHFLSIAVPSGRVPFWDALFALRVTGEGGGLLLGW